jgi:hypothetical protein
MIVKMFIFIKLEILSNEYTIHCDLLKTNFEIFIKMINLFV